MDTKSYIDKAERWFGDTPSEQSAQVMATLAIAEQLKRIADELGNIHQALITPNDNADRFGVVELLMHIAYVKK